MIESYSFGSMRIKGVEHRKDLVLFGPGVRGPSEEVRAGWWREEGHALSIADLDFLAGSRPSILVIGRGAYGRMEVPRETVAALEAMGVEEVICSRTGEAVEAYNRLAGTGASVAGAFHLTC